ncbi:hypothetical protein F5X96DRAFT_511321 [Biscogniauxia mediterranea]|nr:hypothetical protein F5X96DRAFT_511321 [Biscogniauxia mediterranea]
MVVVVVVDSRSSSSSSSSSRGGRRRRRRRRLLGLLLLLYSLLLRVVVVVVVGIHVHEEQASDFRVEWVLRGLFVVVMVVMVVFVIVIVVVGDGICGWLRVGGGSDNGLAAPGCGRDTRGDVASAAVAGRGC